MRDHRLDDVGDGENACAGQDLVAAQAVRIAGAIEALVMLQDDLGDGTTEVDRREDLVSGRRVRLDERELSLRQA